MIFPTWSPEPLAIVSFSEKYAFLSNFYPCTVQLQNPDGAILDYPSVEHAYQAAKTRNPMDRDSIRLLASTPGEAKRMGRKLTLRSDWETQKIIIMTQLLNQKFAAGLLRLSLKATGDRTLIEGNTWGDKTWGCVQSGNGWVGHNLLGTLLMQLRKTIR